MPITSNSVLSPLLTLTPMLTSVLTPYLKSATVRTVPAGQTKLVMQCYRAVVICIFGAFSWLGDRYDCGLSPGGLKFPSFPNIIDDLEKELRREASGRCFKIW